jgi:hypothetical protein
MLFFTKIQCIFLHLIGWDVIQVRLKRLIPLHYPPFGRGTQGDQIGDE